MKTEYVIAAVAIGYGIAATYFGSIDFRNWPIYPFKAKRVNTTRTYVPPKAEPPVGSYR